MYFPIFIELADKQILVVGAGKIGTRRIKALLPFGAGITVVAKEASEEIRILGRNGEVTLIQREWRYEDIAGKDMVIAAVNCREVNHQIYLQCREQNIPVNVADCREECSFYFPGIARNGELIAGVCAGGKDHRLAKEMTEKIRGVINERTGNPGRQQGKQTGSRSDHADTEANKKISS